MVFRLSKITRISASAILLAAAASSSAEFDLQLGASSEYVRQGIKESSSTPTLHAGITYSHQSGLYAGSWLTQVNRRKDKTQAEIDYYAGWYLPVTTNIATDLGYTRYTFHGDKITDPLAYGEGFFNLLLWDSLTLGYRHSDNFKDSDEELQTLEIAQTFIGEEFSFELSARQYRYLKLSDKANFGSGTHDDYFHFRLGVARSFGDSDISLSLERTNLGDEFDGNTQILLDYNRHFSF